MRISVVGTGYLGATHAACLASWDHDVVGVDPSEERIRPLCQGRASFHEPALDDLLSEGVSSGRLAFTTDVAAVAGCDVHFVCVGTPQSDDGLGADLSALWCALDQLAPSLRPGSLVVGKSTIPVGTARVARDRLRATTGRDVDLAWNPEFLREGRAVEDSLLPERLVLGVCTPRAEQVLRQVYRPLVKAGVPVVVTDLETAELAKVSANLMLAARIGLVNVLAEVCERSGADAADLTTILGLDRRIGPHALVPGIGYGGGCLPKDSRAFAARAQQLGVPHARGLVAHLEAVNRHQAERTVALVEQLLGTSLSGARVGVLGAAFKADSDDVRESPALAVADLLHARGATLRVYDPAAGDNVRKVAPHLEVAETAEGACAGADVVAVLTEWREFADLDPQEVGRWVRQCNVLDGRRVLDARAWRAAGWRAQVLGEGTPCAS